MINPVTGTWRNPTTDTYLTVAVSDGALLAIFVQDGDGEVEPVSNASYVGGALPGAPGSLRFTLLIPSTAYTLTFTLTLDAKGRLVGHYTGNIEGNAVWIRVSTQAIAPPIKVIKATGIKPRGGAVMIASGVLVAAVATAAWAVARRAQARGSPKRAAAGGVF